MGGAIWSTWRSVRGIEVTYRLMHRARWSEYGIEGLLDSHVALGIADDGSPTGIEHAFRWESFRPDLLVLVSRWRDPRGALRLRELYRGSAKTKELSAVLNDVAVRRVREQHAVRAEGIDLDVLHELAHDSRDLGELARRWSTQVRFRDVAFPRCFPEQCRIEPYSKTVSEDLVARRDAIAGVERELLDQIEADPKSTATLLVYADWLETAGRLDEAAAVRARL